MKKELLLMIAFAVGCGPQVDLDPYVPSRRFSEEKKIQTKRQALESNPHARARLHMADGEISLDLKINTAAKGAGAGSAASSPILTNDGVLPGDVAVYRSDEQEAPPYKSSLEIGEPGVSASLWRENRGGNELYRDFRAWQPMDIITITVAEKDKGTNKAKTSASQESTYQAAIENFLALENQVATWSPKHIPDLANLINATTTLEYEGDGETSRDGQLAGKISAVVVEVLPTGVLRIEGEKIVSVNDEEQVMIVSGLVRQRDISSNNEILSSQIAQLRIDYFGKGTVGDVQAAGWLGRIIAKLWPF